ncbi:hypothetical protein DPMN_069757 [Dreissena polymorpha]|uniref:Uncharacterized protein n=1 Tax=Dreissena polymorpha TaxID=45954 RepID=A0A9D4BV69_DREPO|nr:hypothetical protein DPMN_069757 [Dreissena polymorpha]
MLLNSADVDAPDEPCPSTKEPAITGNTPVKTSLVLPCKSPPDTRPVSTSAKDILKELSAIKLYTCGNCRKDLPEDAILQDNSNASVGCDCENCGRCDTWFCWPCAMYSQEWADEGINWYCPHCVRECDIVY